MILPDLSEEKKFWQEGYQFVAGVDEVGRGAWAGPVIAAAVIFPIDVKLPEGIRDSKLLQSRKRAELAKLIKEIALGYSIGLANIKIVNNYGIVNATQRAMRKALRNLDPAADFLLVDAFHIRYLKRRDQLAIKKGDQKCISIAAASILAKVYRDELMQQRYHRRFPQYRFCSHKGYGTKEHQEAILRWGLCPIHRVQFVPERIRNELLKHPSGARRKIPR